jgi:hypothetical protein
MSNGWNPYDEEYATHILEIDKEMRACENLALVMRNWFTVAEDADDMTYKRVVLCGLRGYLSYACHVLSDKEAFDMMKEVFATFQKG